NLILEKQLKYLVRGTKLSNDSTEFLLNRVSKNFKKVVLDVKKQKEGFATKLEEVKLEFGDNSAAYKAVNYRRGQFSQKFVLSYLAEVDFLPNAGLPTGIVDFEKFTISDLKSNNPDKFHKNPTYPITSALTEF